MRTTVIVAFFERIVFVLGFGDLQDLMVLVVEMRNLRFTIWQGGIIFQRLTVGYNITAISNPNVYYHTTYYAHSSLWDV
jgi:hypothetical protein